MDLKNNTILITGGSRGIGLEFAKQFLSLGNRVIIIGRDSNRLKRVQDQFPEIHVLQLDLSDPDFIQKLKANPPPLFREVNILLNNAGIGRRINLKAPPMDLDLLEEVQVNLNAPIQLTNLLLPQLLEKRQAAIVNVTSALAFLPLAKVPIYSATKAGLHSFTLSLRKQFHKSTVRVFEIAPPTTDTEMLKGFHANDLNRIKPMTPEEVVQQSIKNMMHEKLETFPGASKKLYLMNRLAPHFIFNQLNRS